MDATGIAEVVKSVRAAFRRGKTLSRESRLRNLGNLLKLVEDHSDDFIEAMHRDFNKPHLEARAYEANCVQREIVYYMNELDNFMKTINVNDGSLLLLGKKTFLKPEPYGVVLIMGAWNYPLQLTLLPLVGAIAAGNCAIVKPSEMNPEFTLVLTKYFTQYMDQDCFRVVNGEKEASEALLSQRFDHILYTGNPFVGRLVMKAAAKNLTPVTLELGGKSPVIVDSKSCVSVSARRIVWGKYVNAAQTCIAPDYILCESSVRDELIDEMKKHLTEFYGSDPKQSQSFGRIINDRHYERLSKLLAGKEKYIVHGGDMDRPDRYISPTFMVDLPLEDPIMQDEIFGPILPIVTVSSLQDALEFVNAREKPLVLYIFSDDSSFIDKAINTTSSGATVVNDTLIHAGVDVLPFGGVGSSGMGSFHGSQSFKTFSHMKPCFVDPYYKYLDCTMGVRYPPYDKKKERVMSLLMKRLTNSEKRVMFMIKLGLLVTMVAVVLKVFAVDEVVGRIIER